MVHSYSSIISDFKNLNRNKGTQNVSKELYYKYMKQPHGKGKGADLSN